MSLKGLWEKIKTGGSWFDIGLELVDVVKDFEIVNILKKLGADTAKVTVNKRFHKREYGQAFTKLSRKERDAIIAIQKELRKKGFLENFILNVSLYGETVEDSADLLRVLAQYGPKEACQLIDDMDLEKPPIHRSKEAVRLTCAFVEAGKRTWNTVDAELARGITSFDRTLRRSARAWEANNYGIEESFHSRIRLPRIRLRRVLSRVTVTYATRILILVVLGTTAAIMIKVLFRY